MSASPGRARALLWGGLGLVGLALLLAISVWRGRSGRLPAEAMAAQEEALSLLRRDDMASREQALAGLRHLVGTYPERVELQAELAVAIALHLDDLRLLAAGLHEKAEQLQRGIAALEAAQTPVDWRNRVNVMRDELSVVQSQLAPLGKQASELAQQAVEAAQRLAVAPEEEPAADAQARLKARGMLAAISGSGDALGMAGRMAREGPRHWGALVLGEYVVNARASPDSLREAAAALERVREEDHTFLRPYVLAARIALMRKEPAAAHALLDAVMLLNPKHELARRLQARAAEAQGGEAPR